MSDLTRAHVKQEPIALIGIGCRFPGDACCPEAFWRLMINGTDAISEIPANRYNIDDYYDPRPGTPGKIVDPVARTSVITRSPVPAS